MLSTLQQGAMVGCLFAALLVMGVAAQEGPGWAQYTHFLRYNKNLDKFTFDNETALPIVVTVYLNESLMVNGWDYIVFDANATASGSEDNEAFLYRAVGYAEGYLTQGKIFKHYNNMNQYVAEARNSTQVQAWMQKNAAFLEAYATANSSTPFGAQLGKILAQLDGLNKGYAAKAPASETMSYDDLFSMSFLEEWGDLAMAFTSKEFATKFLNSPTGLPRHCSALIRVLHNDVFFSHITWTHFESMMRQFKTYRFEDTSVTMSSYPGVLHSIDDWYMTSHKLGVMETTNGIFNIELYHEFVREGYNTVPEFMRVMIANYLAADAPTWVEYFKTLNNGLYSNQFMVFDFKKFSPGMAALEKDTFWIAEQLPGSVTSADMTHFLNQNQHWPSYNMPYFENVRNLSGTLQREQQFGSFFSYTNYSRALIFKRNYSDVVDLDSMKRMMRFNHYETDPYSVIPNCSGTPNNTCSPTHSAMLTIASRGDLNPPNSTSEYGVLWHYVTQRDHGATDAKIATYSNMMRDDHSVTGIVISGPTYDDQPVFQWSTSPWRNDPSIHRAGLPDRYDFPWVNFTVRVPGSSKKDKHGYATAIGRTVAIIVGSVIGGSAVVAVLFVLVRAHSFKKSETEPLVQNSA